MKESSRKEQRETEKTHREKEGIEEKEEGRGGRGVTAVVRRKWRKKKSLFMMEIIISHSITFNIHVMYYSVATNQG